jgi:serine protease Do
VVRLEQLADVADDFVRVRLIKISGADLNVFDFDYDLTWVALFLNADEKVYHRYGGRDAGSPDSRLSLAGLRYTMGAALADHRREPSGGPPRRPENPLRAEDYPAAKRLKGNECIHCHQVNEFRRQALKAAGRWRREDLWVYPLPENIGLTLDVDQGDRVRAVAAASPADRVGLRAGDTLRVVNGQAVASSADVQYALHRGPAVGRLAISWQHDGAAKTAEVELAEGWRKTNLTWRPSLLDILPSLPLYGEDLEAAEKKALGLSEKQLAFRQDRTVHREAKAAGVQPGDIVVGIDNRSLEMTLPDFLAYVRRNHLVGDRITLNVLRDGKRVDLPLTLR